MKTISTTDVWTEQHANHYDCFNGAFVDGIEGNVLPYDKYKVVKNCNCTITSNMPSLSIGNKHNAIIFYDKGEVVRLVVADEKTDIEECIKRALSQPIGHITIGDILKFRKVQRELVDLKEKPIYNEHNSKDEADVGSCDRLPLLKCMLEGSYTESETGLGNHTENNFSFNENVKIRYALFTNEEVFNISHTGAFLNSDKTRAIILQENSSLSLEDVYKLLPQEDENE